MLPIADADIGGARVRRSFFSPKFGGQVQANRHFTADEVLSIPIANRRALVENGFIEVYPKRAAPAKPIKEERWVIRVSRDSDKFDVVSGRKLNQKPLTRVEANRLAGRSATK